MIEHSLGVDDLKKFDLPAKEIEKDLACFNKCFYDKLLILNENGEISTENLESIPLVNLIDESKYNDLKDCLMKIGKIEECEEVKKLENCFVTFI